MSNVRDDELQSTVKAPFRLAMRAEGAFWNAYLAHADTMSESMLLGSIRLAAVEDRDRKTRFMALMQASQCHGRMIRSRLPNTNGAAAHER